MNYNEILYKAFGLLNENIIRLEYYDFTMYDYFGIQAKIGLTKHIGGLKATKEFD